MIDICIITPGILEARTQRGGGIEEQHYRVGLELSKYLHTVIISSFYKHFQGQSLVNDNFMVEEVYFPSCKDYPPKSMVERYIIPFSMVLYSLLASIKIISLAKRGLKIVIVTDILTGLLPAVLAKLLGVKVIFSEGNSWPWVNPYVVPMNLSVNQKIMYSTKILIGSLLAKVSNFIRVQSASIKRGMVKNGIDHNKIVVIGPGIDTNMFKPTNKNDFSCMKFRIGFVGRLTDEKGSRLLFAVCKKAEKVIPEVSFMIMGGGPHEKLFKSLRNIEHIGWVPRITLPGFLSQVQAVLFFQKDLGIAELEAMASGKAVIACNTKGVSQIIKNMENGLLCEPKAASYVGAIKILCQNHNLVRKLSYNARETALRNFSWDSVGMQWVKLIFREMNYRWDILHVEV